MPLEFANVEGKPEDIAALCEPAAPWDPKFTGAITLPKLSEFILSTALRGDPVMVPTNIGPAFIDPKIVGGKYTVAGLPTSIGNLSVAKLVEIGSRAKGPYLGAECPKLKRERYSTAAISSAVVILPSILATLRVLQILSPASLIAVEMTEINGSASFRYVVYMTNGGMPVRKFTAAEMRRCEKCANSTGDNILFHDLTHNVFTVQSWCNLVAAIYKQAKKGVKYVPRLFKPPNRGHEVNAYIAGSVPPAILPVHDALFRGQLQGAQTKRSLKDAAPK